jgi:hypothetical protein
VAQCRCGGSAPTSTNRSASAPSALVCASSAFASWPRGTLHQLRLNFLTCRAPVPQNKAYQGFCSRSSHTPRGRWRTCPDVTYYQADLIQNKNDLQAFQVATADAMVCLHLDPTAHGITAEATTGIPLPWRIRTSLDSHLMTSVAHAARSMQTRARSSAARVRVSLPPPWWLVWMLQLGGARRWPSWCLPRPRRRRLFCPRSSARGARCRPDTESPRVCHPRR